MKTRTLLNLIFVILLPTHLVSQNDEKNIREKVREISDSTSFISYKITTDVNQLFKLVKTSIAEADKISEKLKKKLGENNKEFTKEDTEEIAKLLKKVNDIYNKIDENRELLYKLLNTYDKEIDIQLEKSKSLVREYQEKLEHSELTRDELLKIRNRSEMESENLQFTETNILIISKIISYLDMFQGKVEAVKRGYVQTNNDIASFFNTVKNGAYTSRLLLDYMELTLELDRVIENANSFTNLKQLTNEINRSLINLSHNIIDLKKSAGNDL